MSKLRVSSFPPNLGGSLPQPRTVEAAEATRLLTVLFTDIVGSTELTAQRGDEQARSIRKLHDRLVRKQLMAHGGREVQTTGDGFLVTFSSVRRAIACACAIQSVQLDHNQRRPDQALSLRLGLNAGEVSSRDDGLFGSAVNLAARVTAKAGPGQVLVTEVVKLLAGMMPGTEFRDRGRGRLKGFPDRWRLYELAWSSDVTINPAAGDATNRHVEQVPRLRAALTITGGQAKEVCEWECPADKRLQLAAARRGERRSSDGTARRGRAPATGTKDPSKRLGRIGQRRSAECIMPERR